MAASKTIYRGAFVHCASLTDLDICEDGSIGVDESGKIAFVLRDVGEGPQQLSDSGWEQAEVVRVKDEGFFFPGFIGRVDTV
jgi:guanine deaminase